MFSLQRLIWKPNGYFGRNQWMWPQVSQTKQIADALAVIGWDGAVNTDQSPDDLTVVLGSWEERFGATLIAIEITVRTSGVRVSLVA